MILVFCFEASYQWLASSVCRKTIGPNVPSEECKLKGHRQNHALLLAVRTADFEKRRASASQTLADSLGDTGSAQRDRRRISPRE